MGLFQLKGMKQEDIDFLLSLETQFRTAQRGYARNMGFRNAMRLKEIWEGLGHKEISFTPSCSACQLNLLRKVGEWWEKEKKVVLAPEPQLIDNNLEEKAVIKDGKELKQTAVKGKRRKV